RFLNGISISDKNNNMDNTQKELQPQTDDNLQTLMYDYFNTVDNFCGGFAVDAGVIAMLEFIIFKKKKIVCNLDNIQINHSKNRWENRKEYVQYLEQYRLNEFSTQVDAIRRGLATIVPIALLPLFTWQELELMVCGKHEIDLELLRANTVYKYGVKATDKHVQYFWQVLEEFTHQQRSNFLRFVWGQSRLPARSEDFQDPFGIQTSPLNDDNVLPVSRMSFLLLFFFFPLFFLYKTFFFFFFC
ncbi:hypothetical protein RFI_30739, partial [Reticulomyxa filosa]